MKKSLTLLAAALVALASTSFAGDKPASGKVSAVSGDSITLANKKTGDKTFKTGADTKVLKADGSTGTLSDIKDGSLLKITAGSSPDQAAQIQIVEKKKDGTKSDKTKKSKD